MFTHHPSQLIFDFDAPITAAVVEIQPSVPTPDTRVDLRDDGSAISVTCAGELLGHVDQKQYRMLSVILGRLDVEIEATLGENSDDGGFEVIVTRTTDERMFRNVVRCSWVADDFQLAA